MKEARRFYALQGAWSGCYEGPCQPHHVRQAAQIEIALGAGPWRILELGAGGGQAAAAAALAGHSVVAVELVPRAAAHAREHARELGVAERLRVIEGDFNEIELEGPFDAVVYWDGFGVGEDADQRQLLCRTAGWLGVSGRVLIEVYTPWHAARSAGQRSEAGGAEREYAFGAEGCRWIDCWWPLERPEERVCQSLRAYSPADLRLLLERTPLALERLWPGPGPDPLTGQWCDPAPLQHALSYTACLAAR